MIGQGGYYSMKDMSWMGIKDLVFIGAMGKPGGARTLPSARLLRHFNVLNVNELSLHNQKHIFNTILEWGFRDHDKSWQINSRNVA
jgi:dynein heavy chain